MMMMMVVGPFTIDGPGMSVSCGNAQSVIGKITTEQKREIEESEACEPYVRLGLELSLSLARH